jgi:hypothetical protein
MDKVRKPNISIRILVGLKVLCLEATADTEHVFDLRALLTKSGTTALSSVFCNVTRGANVSRLFFLRHRREKYEFVRMVLCMTWQKGVVPLYSVMASFST